MDKFNQKLVSDIKPAQPRRRLSVDYRRRLAKLAYRTDLLQRAVQADTRAKSSRSQANSRARPKSAPVTKTKRWLATGIILLILGVTGYISVDAWLTNRQVKQQFTGQVDTSASPDQQAADHQQSSEGRDETAVTPNLLASYQVAPDQPRALYIDKLDVEARLLPMGVNPDGSMQAPYNIFDAGWYKDSAQPSGAGAVVIDAHASGPTRQGLFAYLDTLVKGDMIVVETGDGQRYTYKVVATETADLDAVDMQRLMLPYGDATHGANFITCTGDWLQGSETYDQRAIVYTELIS